jgi:hypothetical protein
MAEPPLCLIVLASACGTKPAPAPPRGLIADHTTPEACCHESAPPISACRSPQTQGSATPVPARMGTYARATARPLSRGDRAAAPVDNAPARGNGDEARDAMRLLGELREIPLRS